MNFLVTGGAGFIGSHVFERLLRDGHRVWAFDDLNSFYDPQLKQRNLREIQSLAKPFEFVHGDITDAAALAGIFSSVKFDQVIHLAARAGVRPSLEQPALYQRVNVEGTVNVLEAARKNGVKKIIIASSSSVYGVNAKVPFSESDPIFSAVSPYAASKLACEALGHTWHHIYKMDVTMLRFFTVYGPRQRPDLAIHKFTRLIDAGQPIELFGDGTTSRDYTWIDDILDGVVAAIDQQSRDPRTAYRIYNLGGSRQPPLRELVDRISSALGKPAVIEWKSEEPGDMKHTLADVDLAQGDLGYSPKVSIDAGIPRFVAWW